jgi:hypothetical protein
MVSLEKMPKEIKIQKVEKKLQNNQLKNLPQNKKNDEIINRIILVKNKAFMNLTYLNKSFAKFEFLNVSNIKLYKQ